MNKSAVDSCNVVSGIDVSFNGPVVVAAVLRTEDVLPPFVVNEVNAESVDDGAVCGCSTVDENVVSYKLVVSLTPVLSFVEKAAASSIVVAICTVEFGTTVETAVESKIADDCCEVVNNTIVVVTPQVDGGVGTTIVEATKNVHMDEQ